MVATLIVPPFSPSVQQPREEMVFSGKYKTGEQILRLANERFAVPEMLFHPADIGIQEMGIPEAIVDAIQAMPEGQSMSHFLLGHIQLSVIQMILQAAGPQLMSTIVYN